MRSLNSILKRVVRFTRYSSILYLMRGLCLVNLVRIKGKDKKGSVTPDPDTLRSGTGEVQGNYLFKTRAFKNLLLEEIF